MTKGPWRSKKYLAWVRTLPCCITKMEGVQAAHINLPGSSGMGQKPPDYLVLPVNYLEHRKWHDKGHPSHDALIALIKRVLQKAMAHGIIGGRLEMEFDTVYDLVREWDRAFRTGEAYYEV